ncbi:hypothetical protein F5B18DRAFT_645919 [Nemania serpens]|nr:hypothetical protein F5B18DRAFT_645919 [Nemania serpens]
MAYAISTGDECRIIYYLDEELNYQLQSPVAGGTYRVKILIPHSQLRYYTRTEYRHGQATALLRDYRTYIRCTIQVRGVDFSTGRRVESWVPFAQIRAEWNEAPAHNGYFTFFGTNCVGGIYHGARYSHSLKFFEGSTRTGPPQLTFQTSSFQIEY